MKPNHELITIEGFRNNEPIAKPENGQSMSSRITCALDGFKLDNLIIKFNIKSRADAEYLISELEELKTMLEIHKYCF